MTEASIKALIESFQSRRQADDVEGSLKFFSPDAVCRLAGSPAASPIAGTHQGTAALRQLLSALIDNWQWQAVEIDSITIQGERAAVHFKLTTIFKPTKTLVTTEIVDIITVRDGKITSFVEFVDTALVARIAGH